MQLNAAPTTTTQAENVVKGWLTLDRQPLGTAIGQQISKIETFTDANGQPIYYIVNLAPSGFVIVSADDLVEPIVGFVPEGAYDPSPDNPLGALVSQDLPNRVAAVRSLQVITDRDLQGKELPERQAALQRAKIKAKNKWDELQNYGDVVETMDTFGFTEMLESGEAGEGLPIISDVRVPPLLQSRWDQSTVCGNACYNYYTPPYNSGNPNNYVSGCVATSMAQLMRFHEYPTDGIGVRSNTIVVDDVPQTAYTRGGDGSGGPYNWNDMVCYPSCAITETQRQAIGALCYDAGVGLGSRYSSDWTSGGGDRAWTLKNFFLYSNAIGVSVPHPGNIGAGLNGMVNPNLDAIHPVLLRIKDAVGYGHSIVCDGYGYNSTTLYHHLNMGWSGSSDVWYNLPDVLDYSVVSGCFYNIFTSGSGEIISGRVTHTSGIPISGATVSAQSNGNPYTTTTNNRGIYALAKVPSEMTYTVSVTKSGYQFTQQVVVTGTSLDDSLTSGNCWEVDFEGSGPLPPEPNIIFVDIDATGNNDGSNWNDAFTSLQGALNGLSTYTDEIRVAQGIYKPAGNNRNLTFKLIDGVIIKGGYAGYGEPEPDARDIDVYETILSGDLNGDDGPNFANNGENSYHVVTGSSTNSSAVLDGFTITGGNANGSGYDGGGMYNTQESRPMVINCTFKGNSAGRYGGGMRNYNSSPLVRNCVFRGNFAASQGGGMRNSGWSTPMVINCTFHSNSASSSGGGMHNYQSNPELNNCIFWGNSDNGGSDESAQIHADTDGTPVVNYCCIQGWTGGFGGVGNIGIKPRFASFANGDYHLKSRAGRWHPGIQRWVKDTLMSPCVDAGDSVSDWTEELWPHGKRINMGAYGGTPQASMSLSDAGNIADLNNNGSVDHTDLMMFTNKWLYQEVLLPEDLDRNGFVNFTDFAIFADEWLWQASWHNP